MEYYALYSAGSFGLKKNNMIIEIIFLILSLMALVMTRILPTWEPWPEPLHNFIYYLVDQLDILGIIFNVADCLDAVGWFINSLGAYLFARLIISLFNWARGSGGIEV